MLCPWCNWKGTPEEYLKHFDVCKKRIEWTSGKKPEMAPEEHNEFVHKQLKKILDEEKAQREIETAKTQETPIEPPITEPETVAEAVEPPEKEEHIIKTFKTEDAFRAWLSEKKLIAEPRPRTGIFKGEDRVASYFETKEGIEVDLVDSETWLYRDGVFMKVEIDGEAMETPVEAPEEGVEETSEETSVEEAGGPSEEELVFENRAWEKAEHPRYVSETLKIGDSEFVFEISYHYPRKQYYVDVSETKDYGKGFKETYGKMEFFADTLDDCFKWVEENYKVESVRKN